MNNFKPMKFEHDDAIRALQILKGATPNKYNEAIMILNDAAGSWASNKYSSFTLSAFQKALIIAYDYRDSKNS